MLFLRGSVNDLLLVISVVFQSSAGNMLGNSRLVVYVIKFINHVFGHLKGEAANSVTLDAGMEGIGQLPFG